MQSVCRPQLWGKCLAGVTAAQTVQSWQIPKPLGTRASPAPGNTCGSPSLVVQDKPHAKCRYGWLVIKKTKKQQKKSLSFSPQCPGTSWKMWAEGQRIRSWSLTTRTVRTKCRESSRFNCMWQMSELRPHPLACRWMVHWPHLQASKRALYQLSGDYWQNPGYVQWSLWNTGWGCMYVSQQCVKAPCCCYLVSYLYFSSFFSEAASLIHFKKNAIDLQKKCTISALVHRLPQWNPVLWLLTRTLCCNFHMSGRKKIQVGHDVVPGRPGLTPDWVVLWEVSVRHHEGNDASQRANMTSQSSVLAHNLCDFSHIVGVNFTDWRQILSSCGATFEG